MHHYEKSHRASTRCSAYKKNVTTVIVVLLHYILLATEDKLIKQLLFEEETTLSAIPCFGWQPLFTNELCSIWILQGVRLIWQIQVFCLAKLQWMAMGFELHLTHSIIQLHSYQWKNVILEEPRLWHYTACHWDTISQTQIPATSSLHLTSVL